MSLSSGFPKRLLALRKTHGLSQPALGHKIGTSGAIIGRYERGEMTPSVEVVRKLADAFGVTLDYLVADRELPNVLEDKSMLARFQALDELEAAERERIVTVIDSLVRDAKARHAYRESA